MRVLLSLFVFVIGIVTYKMLPAYTGDASILIAFTVIANFMLLYGLRRNAIFLDTFLGISLWLGFWLKFVVKLHFENAYFFEVRGDVSQFDRALLVSLVGMAAVIFASWIRERFVFSYSRSNQIHESYLYELYIKYRRLILTAFVFLIVTISLSNLVFGIYQRGEIPKIQLPFIFSGTMTWLVMFGMASIGAMIWHFENTLHRKVTFLPVALSLTEVFVSAVSMFSRAMIINSSAIGYGAFKELQKYKVKVSWTHILMFCLLLGILTAVSVAGVNYIRSAEYFEAPIADNTRVNQVNGFDEQNLSSEGVNTSYPTPSAGEHEFESHQEVLASSLDEGGNDVSPESQVVQASVWLTTKSNIERVIIMTKPLFIDRWIGVEGVLAILHHADLGWSLWVEAWDEEFSYDKASFYDSLTNSQYMDVDTTKHHFINLPGIVAFLFYPGSFIFLFAVMTSVVLATSLIEVAAYKLSLGNMIFSALIAQVMVFRLSNFGYVPSQSYLLFGTVLLNIFLIFGANKILGMISKNSRN